MVDSRPEMGIARPLLGAATERLDRLDAWFDDIGQLKPVALHPRLHLADVGWPPAPPPRDETGYVLDEVFALAAFNGRLAAMQRLLELGADVNGAAHLGLTDAAPCGYSSMSRYGSVAG